MKCPKCGYLGFEHVERCRNCGYDFSLVPAAPPDLPIRSADSASTELPDDLALINGAAELAPPLDADVPPPRAASELPLFGGPADDLPLISKPSPPRPPLAVRRATPDVPRMRSETPRTPLLDLSGPAPATGRTPGPLAPQPDGEWRESAAEPAGIGARTAAAALDLALLAAIDVMVVYFTLKICGLTAADLNALPKGPLALFLLVQNGGYLVAFTARGQTLGKMAAGIRVVSTRGTPSIDVAHSLVRTIVWVLLVVPAGMGFVTALFSREHRGLHDQCAGTRVIKAVG
jgi:uncharacterized RDD family membrane protein YckC